ncbi:hypothetical protein ACHAXT_012063 [Thalassiosira profunda]
MSERVKASDATPEQARMSASGRSKSRRDGLSASGRSASSRLIPVAPRLSFVKIEVGRCPAVAGKLTSDVFGPDYPPVDWADCGLLIPHEAIRRQMSMLVQSVTALPDDPAAGERWKVVLFAKWYVRYFFESVLEHHDAEEELYFPWIQEKAEYPEKEMSKDHEDLLAEMEVMKKACEAIVARKGNGCAKEIAVLKKAAPGFEKDMRAHLKEEEETFPKILREHFTQEEEGAIVEKILQGGGLAMARTFLPAVIAAMQEWASKEFYDEFVASMPPPIRHLAFTYYVPDYENVVVPMRDAPTLAKKPALKRVGCFGIPFCFPCIL